VHEIVRSRAVAAPPAAVWSRLADFGAIDRWAANVDHSCLLREPDEPPGIGTVRRVQVGRTTLLERVVTWQPDQELAYDIDGLPPVVRCARNVWRLHPQGAHGTLVELASQVDCGSNPAQRLLARGVGLALARASDRLLDGLVRACSQPTSAATEDRSP